ncbi:MAG: hypothetical protein JF628_08785 [Sphingomonas sp.]|nr:hypothetical protein [Sphingomonas sp.]
MFEHFLELQDRILAISTRAEAILRSETRDVAALGQARWELARVLREYQLFNQGRIFDQIERMQDGRAAKVRSMKAECVRVGEEFRLHILKWSAVSVIDHWAAYQPAALDTIARIRTHLVCERAGMAELLQMKSAA